MSIFKANQKYDLSGLNELFGGNQHMINEIVMLFLEQAPRHIEEMQESHQQQNFDLLGIVAHKAKSSVVMLGLNELASKLSKIEKDTRDRKNYDGLEALLNEALDEYKIVFDQFKNFLDGAKGA
ncbi:MAG: Hpt domain-containing protein [Flavobacteriales bacterium]|nr:Hpt domain-containing protein [Flavobacteriales bacterium]MDG1766549.1 Hpt domain-containing protein [Flavobacteriales bacterium]